MAEFRPGVRYTGTRGGFHRDVSGIGSGRPGGVSEQTGRALSRPVVVQLAGIWVAAG